MTDMLNDLRQAATPPAPKDFRPGVVFAGSKPHLITTDAIPPVETEEEWEQAVRDMGIFLPKGFGLQLVEAVLAGSTDPAAWRRDEEDAKANLAHSAYTKPKTTQRWRYRFKVVLKSAREDVDIALLEKEARKAIKGRKLYSYDVNSTMVINLADFQTGKTDERGGTAELLERSEFALEQVLQQVKKMHPAEIVLIDNGDSTEGFESSPNAQRTSDLQQTEQIRVWRRIFFRWIDQLARFRVPMRVVSVPSNHCAVRNGKDKVGNQLDDWGIEVLSQVNDMCAQNPERFGHVEFIQPREFDRHVTLTLLGGKILSAHHGHDANNPNGLMDWAKRQGRRDIGLSDIVVVGHFHHLRVVTYGDNQTLFVCPTMDPGSSWFTPASGEASDPGVLTFMVDESGWRDLFVAWAA